MSTVMRATVSGPSETRLQFFRDVADVPLFMPLFVASVLVGFRDSMSLPYNTLFAVERAHMGPLEVGVFLTLRAAGAIVASLLFGAWFDRKPSLWPLLVALGSGAAGYGMMTATTDFVWLCLIGTVPLGVGAAAFPLLFAAEGLGGEDGFGDRDSLGHASAGQLLARLGRRPGHRRGRGARGQLRRAVLGQRRVQRGGPPPAGDEPDLLISASD